MLGFKEHEFPNVLGSWDAQLHPDDRARVFAAVTAHLDRQTPRYDIEYRLFTKAGGSPAGSARAGKPFGTNPDTPSAWQGH